MKWRKHKYRTEGERDANIGSDMCKREGRRAIMCVKGKGKQGKEKVPTDKER